MGRGENQRECTECHQMTDPPECWMETSEIRKIMEARGCCFGCGFWFECLADQRGAVVIEGRRYTLGREDQHPGAFRGFGGDGFDIEYFDGRKVRTTNLWHNGVIPDHFRDRMPDTARFLRDAGAVKVGDTTCWNR